MHSVDDDLVTRITKALLQDQHNWTAVIEVHGKGSIVRLSGFVSSEEGRQAAETVCRQGGVVDVVNGLQVQTQERAEPATHRLLNRLFSALRQTT